MAILTLSASIFIIPCCDKKPRTYKHVVSISKTENTYAVTVTEHDGGNTLKRAAVGALIGGGGSMLLGGSGKGGAVVGGLVGAATTTAPTTKTYQTNRTDVTYHITFSDSTTETRVNYCPFSVGDSVQVYRNQNQ